MGSRAEIFVWLVLPYVSTTIFVVGHWWRYRRDQFGWTSRSSQLLESRLLAWGSTLFHYGALAVIGGHVVGILIPASVTGRFRISESNYHHLSGMRHEVFNEVERGKVFSELTQALAAVPGGAGRA